MCLDCAKKHAKKRKKNDCVSYTSSSVSHATAVTWKICVCVFVCLSLCLCIGKAGTGTKDKNIFMQQCNRYALDALDLSFTDRTKDEWLIPETQALIMIFVRPKIHWTTLNNNWCDLIKRTKCAIACWLMTHLSTKNNINTPSTIIPKCDELFWKSSIIDLEFQQLINMYLQ